MLRSIYGLIQKRKFLEISWKKKEKLQEPPCKQFLPKMWSKKLDYQWKKKTVSQHKQIML